jgi:hypothetical protein
MPNTHTKDNICLQESFPSLPLELWIQAIRGLAETSDLIACSRVSRSLRDAAQTHDAYFHNCKLHTGENEPSWDKISRFEKRLDALVAAALPIHMIVHFGTATEASGRITEYLNMPFGSDRAFFHNKDPQLVIVDIVRCALTVAQVVELDLHLPQDAFPEFMAALHAPMARLHTSKLSVAHDFESCLGSECKARPLPSDLFARTAPRLRDVSISAVTLPSAPILALKSVPRVWIESDALVQLDLVALTFPNVQHLIYRRVTTPRKWAEC